MLRALFLQAPSFDGFDGGAGSRYQAKREIRSFWFPTWLAQPAALVPGSKLIDAPPAGISLKQVVDQANDFDCRNEFDFTWLEIAEDKPWETILGLSYRDASGEIHHNPDRPILEEMDALPSVIPVYQRDLKIEDYFIGYLKHPYVSVYTGRGCKSRCTFCLWPQTVGGHRYRVRSVDHVVEEIAEAKRRFPEVKEFFFDDDTFTDNLPRAEAIAKELSKLGVTWSCNAKANVPYATLKVLRDNGLRLLLVGYESGNQQILHNIKKGMRIEVAERFTK